MIITVLGSGTSGGVPMLGCRCAVCQSTDPHDKRLRSSILVQSEETTICIDAGPDFRQQLLREKIDRLDAILFTHEHKDHTGGLDDIRAYNYWQKKPMDLYLTEDVEASIRKEYYYAFENTYPGLPQMHFLNIQNQPFYIQDIKFQPILVYHAKLPVFGYRIRNFAYITDANFIPEEEKEKIKGSDILVINALRLEKHVSHFTLDEALALIHELNPRIAYLTHISHQLGKHAEIETTLPENVRLAYDGLRLEI